MISSPRKKFRSSAEVILKILLRLLASSINFAIFHGKGWCFGVIDEEEDKYVVVYVQAKGAWKVGGSRRLQGSRELVVPSRTIILCSPKTSDM